MARHETFPMTMADLPPASLRLRFDKAALTANWSALDRLSGNAATGAAVKANAYGLGVRHVIPALRVAGCEQFFVAHWSEVPDVLDHAPAAMVSVLHGVASKAEAAFARSSGVTPVINSLEQAALWQQSGGGRCHLMVDTGINRLGISPAEAGLELVATLDVDILMSHLACADEDTPQNTRQLRSFSEVSASIAHRQRSLANSAGIALGQDYAFDLTRPGLALYGGIPRPELAGTIRQVAFPEAAILQVRDLHAGDAVGYNARFTAAKTMRVATVSIGYADGFLRARGAACALQHEGRELPVLGQVSMDMIVVDCTVAPDLRAGDFLSVPFDLPREAARSGLSQYELLTTIGSRFDKLANPA
jgi:alanine racemase